MKMQIPINGISTSSDYKDGDMMSLVNLRKKTGVLEPVPPRKIIKTISDVYDLVFVHQLPSTQKNWIGVKNNAIYLDANNTKTFLCSTISLISITQIGNVLNILDAEGVKYLLWYDNQYKLISTAFDGEQTDTSIHPLGRVDFKVEGDYEPPTVYLAENSMSGSSAIVDVAEVISGLFDKAISIDRQKGYMKGFALAIAAYELYDGSTILHSRPMLLGQPYDSETRYSMKVGGEDVSYITDKMLHYYGGIGGIHIKDIFRYTGSPAQITTYDKDNNNSYLLTQGKTNLYPSNEIQKVYVSKALVRGEEGLSTYPIPTRDPAADDYWDYYLCSSLDAQNYPNPKPYQEAFEDYPLGTYFLYEKGMGGIEEDYVIVRNSTKYEQLPFPNLIGFFDAYPELSYNPNGLYYPAVISRRSNVFFKVEKIDENLKQLIKSVGIFMTPEVLMYKDENYKRVTRHTSGSYNTDNYLPDLKTNEEIINELMSHENFYKVQEIDFDDLEAGEWIKLNLEGKLGDALKNQEELKIDPMSHHLIIPKKQYVYNSRLHVADYERMLSRGFPAQYFENVNSDIGQFYSKNYDTINELYSRVFAEVRIKTEQGEAKVVRYNFSNTLTQKGLAPILSYPDRNAKSLRIVRQVQDYPTGVRVREQTYPLKAHASHNFAYYISDDLKPIDFLQVKSGVDIPIPDEEKRGINYPNTLKVSGVNNPFFFPDINTYVIGTGIIRNICSNAMRISEGQFGQFPLYIFTTENIYALNVGGGDVLYSTQSPVSNETPVSDVICQTPYGIVFIGKRGLYVISGQNVELLTPFLETHPDDITLSLPTVEKAPNIGNLKTWNDNFLEYLSDVSEIAYDSKESEIILLNTKKDYNLVFNISSKMWYQQTEDVTYFAKNVYPELYGIKNTSVKDFSKAQTKKVDGVDVIDKTKISLVARPINFGSMEYKTIEQLILRARLRGENIIILTNTSRDGLNFDLDKGMSLKNGNYKDINLGRFVKKYRNIIVMFTAEVEADAKIYLIDANVDGSYTKMM